MRRQDWTCITCEGVHVEVRQVTYWDWKRWSPFESLTCQLLLQTLKRNVNEELQVKQRWADIVVVVRGAYM